MDKKAALLAVVLAVVGLLALLWPVVSGHRLQGDMSETSQEFLEEADQPYPELLADLREYNERIYAERQAGLADAAACEEPAVELRDYGVEDEVIGVLEIPALELVMPVYLGASDSHLAAGATVLGNTSAPIGGMSTNCVVAGHRGWYGADYFRHIDRLQAGDTVTITSLWETLTYAVVDMKIIQPDQVDKIKIQPGRDLLTLITCHPYASGGRQRLVVYCERVRQVPCQNVSQFETDMTEAGFTGFERGVLGSTAENLSSLDYQIQKDKERLAHIQERIEAEQVRYVPAHEVRKTMVEIEGMGQKTITGKIAVSKDDYQQLTALAKEGITSRSEIQNLKSSVSYYQRQYFNASSAVERLQERYDRLKEKCQPFLQALEHFPKLVEVFVEKVKELFSIKEAQERKEREDRAAARKEQSKHRRGRNDWER